MSQGSIKNVSSLYLTFEVLNCQVKKFNICSATFYYVVWVVLCIAFCAEICSVREFKTLKAYMPKISDSRQPEFFTVAY